MIKMLILKTVYLKTAIIENECIIRLKRDIFDVPKYLRPLIDPVSFRCLTFFCTWKTTHNQALSDIN